MRARCLLSVFVLFIVFVVFPVNSWAAVDWIKVIGPNASACGRGGTTIAIGDDPGSMEVNPALISEIENNAFEASLMLIFPDFDFKYNGTGGKRYTSSDQDRKLAAPGMSYVRKVKDSPWSWGLSFSAPDAVATDYTIQSKFFGPMNASSEILHMRFGPVVAYQITPELSVGVRLDMDYGSMDLRMPLGMALIDLSECVGFGVSGSVGLYYKPRKNLSFGIYYETPTALQDLESRNADGYLGMVTPGGNMYFSNLDVTVKNVQFPQNCGFGVAYSPIPSLRLSADAKYIDWNSDWDKVTVKYSGSGGTDMQNAGLPTTLTLPLNIDSQLTYSLGAEYFFGEAYKVSLGYHYNDNAMSDNYLLPFSPAEVEHTLTLGFSFKPVKSFKMTLAYMYCFMDDSTTGSHGYDSSLEKQLGMPPGSLQSELNDSGVDYDTQVVQFSASFYW